MKLFKHINNTAIYIRKQQLTLPIHSILEEYKPETLKTVIFGAQKLMKFEGGTHILEMESDNRSQWSNWQIETSRYGWNRLKQKEEDLVSTSYKLFYLSAGKGKQNNVIKKSKVGWTGRTVFTSCEIQSTGTVYSMGRRGDWTENKLEGKMGIKTCNIEFSVKINVRHTANSS